MMFYWGLIAYFSACMIGGLLTLRADERAAARNRTPDESPKPGDVLLFTGRPSFLGALLAFAVLCAIGAGLNLLAVVAWEILCEAWK